MEQLNYGIIQKRIEAVHQEAINIQALKEYNIKQNYFRAVSRLCESGYLDDWRKLNAATDFKTVKTGESWNDARRQWVQFIDKYIRQDGKTSTSYDDLKICFNPQSTWVKRNGDFGVYRSYGSCGDTNLLSFGPDDVDTVNGTIRWYEFLGTDKNKVSSNGSWFGDAYELKIAIINEFLENYERYRVFAFDKTLKHIEELEEAARKKRAEAEAILEA